MAIIDASIWKPKSRDFIFAFRFPESNLSTHTQLVVYESQEAVLISKGKIMGKFGPGKHTLNTENLPILRNLFGIPFGGKNPFTAEVWYVNKLLPTNLSWSTNRMTIHDPDYNTQMPLTASGQYGLKVVDAERFLVNLVGTKDEFTEHDMRSQCEGEFNTKVKSTIMKWMMGQQIGFKRISACLDELSEALRESIAPFWGEYGLEMTKFYVSTIEIDDSEPDGARMKEALINQSEMHITGHTWQQEQAFGMANNAMNAAGNMGSGGGLLGSLMAMNMMNSMGSGMGGGMGSGMMQPAYNQPTFGGNQQGGVQQGGMQQGGQMSGAIKMIYCANCSKKHSNQERFCPYCGSEYNPCPRCGSDNKKNAKRCISCGTPLQSTVMGGGGTCMNCGASLQPGAAFCPSCGTPTASVQSNVCARCGATLSPGAKFCPNCGFKH